MRGAVHKAVGAGRVSGRVGARAGFARCFGRRKVMVIEPGGVGLRNLEAGQRQPLVFEQRALEKEREFRSRRARRVLVCASRALTSATRLHNMAQTIFQKPLFRLWYEKQI